MTDSRYAGLDREALIDLLERRDAAQQFGLVWEQEELEAVPAPTLTLDLGLSVGDAPHHNLIIEGDNLDALRFLGLTHRGRIKCIYIDPPYNTGDRSWPTMTAITARPMPTATLPGWNSWPSA